MTDVLPLCRTVEALAKALRRSLANIIVRDQWGLYCHFCNERPPVWVSDHEAFMNFPHAEVCAAKAGCELLAQLEAKEQKP